MAQIISNAAVGRTLLILLLCAGVFFFIDFLVPALAALIARDLAVSDSWISDDELLANPGLIKTMSVRPPMGQGKVRLVRIGDAESQIDLQPCGGTHVARTAEIGEVEIGKIEKKGKLNRRVSLILC